VGGGWLSGWKPAAGQKGGFAATCTGKRTGWTPQQSVQDSAQTGTSGSEAGAWDGDQKWVSAQGGVQGVAQLESAAQWG